MELTDFCARVRAPISTSILVCKQDTLWQGGLNGTIRCSGVKNVTKDTNGSDGDGSCGRGC